MPKPKIQTLSKEQINTMTKDSLENLVNKTRVQVEKKLGIIERSGLFSYAAEKFGEVSKKDTSKMSRNALLAEVITLKDFMDAKTSTIKGIKEINREQDARIFGFNTAGRIKRKMTETEREKFWALIEEWRKQNNVDTTTKEKRKRSESFWGSSRIQETVGEMITTGGIDFTQDKIEEITKRLEMNRMADNESDKPNIFSGQSSNGDY